MNIYEFEKKLTQTNQAVIVDLWAPWCVPCRTTKPVLEALAEEFAGRVAFLAANADDSRGLVEHYRVLGIPTVLTFQDGQLIGRVTGAQNEANYRRLFESTLQGEFPQLPLASIDRVLRLGAGFFLTSVALLTGVWSLAALGAFLGFLGVHDRCPVWQAIRARIQKR
ncbi:MAG: thioredoxin family protein [Anaerolineales bacterium]